MSNILEDPEKKYELITKDLQEVLNPQIIKEILNEKKRPLNIYWGTAPTGKPHCGYFVPMIQLAYFLKAGCQVTILLADLHAFLDNMKAPLEVVQYRAKFYELLVKSLLTSIGVPIEKLKFVVGSSYQLTPEYTLDLFKLANIVSQNEAKRAGADVVLDEHYLGVDAQFGGVDQRKIFVLAEETIESLGYKKRAHLMNPMVPGLGQGGKMSSSDANSKVDVLEKPKQVRKKINSAFCAPGNVEENGLLSFVRYVLAPIHELKHEGEFKFFIDRPEKYGGPITFHSFEDLKTAFKEEKLSPVDLKSGVSDGINQMLEPIIKDFEASPEFQEAEARGYPTNADKKGKKAKKQKNRGTKYPGKKDDKEQDELTKKLQETKISN
ncbi:Tyrosine--tRNA ligase cytoplasmic [Brettanomyces nanus]|uniref:Tyrosine--tRNA ligase n=1 Tax=Eeniella nana TaxID=13502 RepID=A0A875RQG6_EENNA|nr:Tyrosine--tRNA ligase cytoplasmic [Brettanomyces nanus]QPG76890.1 Tyrosine--tRNA ligase cytoplasmic [Brettanomyces nanus]